MFGNEVKYSKMHGHVNPASFFELLSRQKFYIPLYQRPYDWDEPQIERIVSDYIFASGSVGKHFVGSILYSVQQDTNRRIIIDGQQRTTSLLLMYLALCMVGFKAGFKHHDAEESMDFFTDWIKLPNNIGFGSERIQDLIEYELDTEQKSFTQFITILNNFIGSFIKNKSLFRNLDQATQKEYAEKLDSCLEEVNQLCHKKSQNRSPNHKFAHNFLYMFNKIHKEVLVSNSKKASIYDLEKLGKWLQMDEIQIEGVSIEIADQSDSIVVFNAINTTGVKLTDAELIRSYLVCDKSDLYGELLDDVERTIVNFQQSSPSNRKLDPKQLYSAFFETLIKACEIRTGKNVSQFVKGSKAEFKGYEFFKFAYDHFELHNYSNAEKFAKIIRRYKDYWTLINKCTDYSKNSFFEDLNLTADQARKLELFLRAFTDYKLLNSLIPEMFVLFERVDAKKSEYFDDSVSKLSFETFIKVMHLIWSFLMRQKINNTSYSLKEDLVALLKLDESEIYEAVRNYLTSAKFDVFDNYSTNGLFKHKYTDNQVRVFLYLLSVVQSHPKLRNNKNTEYIDMTYIMPNHKDRSWHEGYSVTLIDNWDKVKSYYKLPSEILPTQELIKQLHEHFSVLLGNFILLNKTSIDNAKDLKFKAKSEIILKDRADIIAQTISSKGLYWGFSDVIDLTNMYGRYILEVCSLNNPDFH